MVKNILIVDDDKSIVSIAAKILSRLDYKVDTTVISYLALSKLVSQDINYDMLITDINMPVIDGPTLAEQAKSACPGIIIIGMSGGNIDVGVIKKFDYFLAKAFEKDELVAIVKEAFSSSKAHSVRLKNKGKKSSRGNINSR